MRKKEELFKKERNVLVEKAKKAKTEGLLEGKKKEKERAERLMAGQRQKILKLEERIRQIEKGSTPQTEGLEFEDKLAARLTKEFPEDTIQQEGKGGDILHYVRHNSTEAGTIIYECKRTPGISSSHIRQACEAKQTREADFAVLVSTGKRKGFSGLAASDGVLIVSPLGVVPLVTLLRNHLIEMLKAKITKEKRTEIALQLLNHITSPQFKNPIEEIISRTSQLAHMIRDEAKQHMKLWQSRWDHYQRIRWDSTMIQNNLQLVLHGKEPEPLTYPKAVPIRFLPSGNTD